MAASSVPIAIISSCSYDSQDGTVRSASLGWSHPFCARSGHSSLFNQWRPDRASLRRIKHAAMLNDDYQYHAKNASLAPHSLDALNKVLQVEIGHGDGVKVRNKNMKGLEREVRAKHRAMDEYFRSRDRAASMASATSQTSYTSSDPSFSAYEGDISDMGEGDSPRAVPSGKLQSMALPAEVGLPPVPALPLLDAPALSSSEAAPGSGDGYGGGEDEDLRNYVRAPEWICCDSWECCHCNSDYYPY